MTSELLWKPKNIEQTNIDKFRCFVNRKRGLHLQSYRELYKWSVGALTLNDFWVDAYEFLGVAPPESPAPDIALTLQPAALFPPPKFFPHVKLNLGEILLRGSYNDTNTVAIYFVRESVPGIEKVTWGNLRSRVRKVYDAMLSHGVRKGDRIAAVISNSVNAIVICVATLSIGAIFSSASPDLGISAIVDRFSQVKPKLIFADNGYVYAGKSYNLAGRIEIWTKGLCDLNNNIKNVVIVPYLDVRCDVASIHTGTTWESFLGKGTGRPLRYELVPFSHPAFILYSSGTTGVPKCIVHSGGGVALKVKLDMQLHNDVGQGDVAFQYTTTSWVMWVLNLVNLATGASLLIYDGSPFYPDETQLLKLADQIGVTIFGTSPRYLAELRKREIRPRTLYPLVELRTVTSTGSVMNAELSKWFYDAFPVSTHLISMCGGTDIAGCFIGGNPTLPVHAGEIQVKILGMAVDVCDPVQSEAVSVEHLGQPGELVCRRPFPSQPVAFYGKDGYKRYQAAYFERFGDSVWCQGDYMQVLKKTKGIVILGRSDGVLNPSGIRFGTAEIYSVTDQFPEIQDSICVGQRRTDDPDESVLLFLKLQPQYSLEESLIFRLKTAIAGRYSPRHVPKHIFAVTDIPYTVNGKKCETNVKQIVNGMKIAVAGTVMNPGSLEQYEKYYHIRRGISKL